MSRNRLPRLTAYALGLISTLFALQCILQLAAHTWINPSMISGATLSFNTAIASSTANFVHLSVAFTMAICAYFGAKAFAFRFALPSPIGRLPLPLLWLLVNSVAWFTLYVWLGGTNPSAWSGSPLISQDVWLPIATTAISLGFGAKSSRGSVSA